MYIWKIRKCENMTKFKKLKIWTYENLAIWKNGKKKKENGKYEKV